MVQSTTDLTKFEGVPFAGTAAVPAAEFVYLQSGGDSGRVPRFFDRLSVAERQTITASSKLLKLKRGELLFRQASPHGGIYIIRKGRIRTFFVAPSGREITLAYWSASHFVGGPEVFGGGSHVWSGMAMLDSEVIYLDRTQLVKLIQEVPAFALALIEGLVFKGQCFSSLVQMLGTRSASSRLANVLLNLSEIHGRAVGDEIWIMRSFTHDELASMIGVTRQWVSVTLSKFRDQGMVRTEGRRLIVMNHEKLRASSN